MRSTLAVLLAGAIWCAAARAQTLPAPPRRSFEVASIKPNLSPDAVESSTIEPGGGMRLTAFPLIRLILGAFTEGRPIMIRDQIIGGPPWIYTDKFDIVAKAEGPLTFRPDGRQPAEGLQMLKTLLADRFAVRVHFETRKLKGFAMEMARRDRRLGPALKPSTAQCPQYGPGLPPPVPGTDRWCGFRHPNGEVNARFVTMAEVVTYFGAFAAIRRPMQDRTQLTGHYDFHVEFSEGPDADAGSLFTAFREQLGLKFESVTTDFPALVIDHAERPTPD